LTIAEGINLNPKEIYYEATPLHIAIERHLLNIVDILAKRGADLNVSDM